MEETDGEEGESMILLYINVTIGILVIVLMRLLAVEAARQFMKQYPDLKPPKKSDSEKTRQFIKGIVMAMCPLFNIAFLWVLIFDDDELMRRTIKKMYDTCNKEDKT